MKETRNKNEFMDSILNQNNAICDFLKRTELGYALFNILEFAVPEISGGSIKVTDSYFDTKNGETVIELEVGDSKITISILLREHAENAVKVKIESEDTERKFMYTERPMFYEE